LAREVASSAAEREPRDSRASDDAERNREPEGVGRVVDVGGRAARLDAHSFEHRQIDDEPVVARSEARAAVPTTSNRDAETVVSRVVDRGDDVRDTDALGNDLRPPLDHA